MKILTDEELHSKYVDGTLNYMANKGNNWNISDHKLAGLQQVAKAQSRATAEEIVKELEVYEGTMRINLGCIDGFNHYAYRPFKDIIAAIKKEYLEER